LRIYSEIKIEEEAKNEEENACQDICFLLFLWLSDDCSAAFAVMARKIGKRNG